MTAECVIDTTVLQKANAPLRHAPREVSRFADRVRLLKRIADGELTLLISPKLLAEYGRQVPEPRNDTVRVFLELITLRSERVFVNWKKRWAGRDREAARHCRFPREDDHVLRTAIRPQVSTIITEEGRMLRADACVYRAFRVHIREPW